MDVDFDVKYNHYDTKAKQLGLRSVWSIYEIEDLDSLHPFGTDIQIAYVKDHDHWGDKTVHAVVKGNTWADLFVAADNCIRNSGDNHHIYIENFTVSSIDNKVLFLHTGS
jgi:hypothetical protein